MNYYAEINGNNQVIATHSLAEQSTNENYIVITQEQYENGNLVGKYYNKLTEVFEAMDYENIGYVGDTNTVQDVGSTQMLSTRLDNMTYDIAQKADENHTHTEYANSDHTHTEYANSDHTHTGFASENHTHTGFANSVHSHSASEVTGLSTVATSGSYNDLSDKPTIPTVPTSLPANGGNADTVDGKHSTDFAPATHEHSQYALAEDVESLETSVGSKANASHTHAQSEITGLETALSGKANSNHSHTQYALADDLEALETTVNGKANTNHTHSEYASTSDISTLQTAINGKANATHSHTEYASASHTHSQYASASDVTEIETALSNKADATHTHTQYASTSHTHADYVTDTEFSSGLGGKANTSHTHAQSDITGLESALSGKANASHTHNLSAIEDTTDYVKMTAAERTKLSGIATGANAITVDSALSSSSTNPVQNKVINTALAGKAASNHNHDTAYISKDLQMTADDGNISVSWSGKDVLAQFKALASGMYTAYSPAGTTNNPNTLEGFRFMCHKTGSANYGWVMAYGTSGSVYTGYLNNGTWQGWKALWEYAPAPLWSGGANGGYYMTSGHTITPTKKLSECRNGWALLWSDYDVGDQANNTDFYVSYIYKRAYTGQVWGGGEWYCDIPSYSAGTATDSEQRVIKVLQIFDAKIVGTANNAAAPRNDVVLRAVYEF